MEIKEEEGWSVGESYSKLSRISKKKKKILHICRCLLKREALGFTDSTLL